MQDLLVVQWSLSATTDVLIAVMLVFLFWKHYSTAELRSTHKLLERLVILTVNTGVWTAVCSLFVIVAVRYDNSATFLIRAEA